MTRAPDTGDPFSGPYDFTELDAPSLSRVFGDSPLVAALLSAPERVWAGPFRSAYGWHLVYVNVAQPARQPGFDEVRERVLADYRERAGSAGREAAFARLRSKYVIVRDRTSAG